MCTYYDICVCVSQSIMSVSVLQGKVQRGCRCCCNIGSSDYLVAWTRMEGTYWNTFAPPLQIELSQPLFAQALDSLVPPGDRLLLYLVLLVLAAAAQIQTRPTIPRRPILKDSLMKRTSFYTSLAHTHNWCSQLLVVILLLLLLLFTHTEILLYFFSCVSSIF